MLTTELTDFERGFHEGCRVCATTLRQAADTGRARGLLDKVSATFLKDLAYTMDPKKPNGGTDGDNEGV